ncbi:energy transducer TonB [Breoghania sp. L-A4]|uniref:energy transducer TonB n=1 Tax=Breoghania sp. L-A4 TaxID=2304600 RepID=UPI000E35A0EE|nr:energy transducer TonB [Breoghania sp. L-A4]AXS41659.1 energy transducer TonB [Breoghania sp. L-A4]
MRFPRLLCAGLIASVGLHAGGSAYMSGGDDAVRIEASAGGAVSVVGSLEDLVAGAEVAAVETPDDPTPPVQAPADPMDPVTTPQVMAAVEPLPVLEPLDVTPAPPRAGVTEVREVTPETAETVTVKPLDAVSETPKTAVPPKPLEARPPVEPVARATPIEPVAVITPDAVLTAKPVRVATLEPVKEKPRKTKPKKVRQPKGAKADSRRGAETVTSDRGRSNANGRATATDGERGQAATSNYKGKVLSRLRRAKRYPREARRAGVSGTATLRFTVSRDGSVSGVRIVRSSGAAVLDEAVLDLIRRASPMPSFPSEVSGNSMTFSVPIRFSRG